MFTQESPHSYYYKKMAFPRNSLTAFLGYASRSFTECIKNSQKVNVVIGNESAGTNVLHFSICISLMCSNRPGFLHLFFALRLCQIHIAAKDILFPNLRPFFEHSK